MPKDWQSVYSWHAQRHNAHTQVRGLQVSANFSEQQLLGTNHQHTSSIHHQHTCHLDAVTCNIYNMK